MKPIVLPNHISIRQGKPELTKTCSWCQKMISTDEQATWLGDATTGKLVAVLHQQPCYGHDATYQFHETADNVLEQTNAAYAQLKQDPEAWGYVKRERALWDSTLLDGLEPPKA